MTKHRVSPHKTRHGGHVWQLLVVVLVLIAGLLVPAQASARVVSGTSFGEAGAVSRVGFTLRYEQITAHDGTHISAIVTEPTAPGPHPVIVMPSSYGINFIEYSVPAVQWAGEGFTVVSYTSRGFWESDGEIDVAGEPTVRDVSTVVDWAIANANGDPARVGAIGISYGAGTALLAAAHDPRIDAVVALSGWADLADSLYPNETISTQAAELLLTLGNITGRPGPELIHVEEQLALGNIQPALDLANTRSAIDDLAIVNNQGTAIMLGNAWNDSFFPPSQVVEYFEGLDGPKKLVLAPGDHATAELPGLLGLPNNQWSESLNWMKHHVAGLNVDTGPLVTVVANDTRRVYTASSWDALSSTERTYYLTRPRSFWFSPATGDLATSSSSTGWDYRIKGGRATLADSGTSFITGILQGYLGIPATIYSNWVDRGGAGVWETRRDWYSRTIAGNPQVDVRVRSSTSDTTVFAYLYEENVFGVASLITHKPYTVRGATPDQWVDVSFDLESTAWDLAPGSSLVLVLDTVDPRYESATVRNSTVRFGSAGSAASLTVPFR